MQKAVEYCHVVKNLGSQLLAAYEKQDAEGLGLLRAEHEEGLLKAYTELRNLQVDEARENRSAMGKSKVLVEERIEYYSNLEKQIVAAQMRLALAEKERDNHALQLTQAREVRDFLSSKFTNQELYGWMVSDDREPPAIIHPGPQWLRRTWDSAYRTC